MSPKGRRRWVVAATILVAVGWLGWLGYRVATATEAYAYRLTYASMPADDEALAAWLRSQPGVSRPSVAREGDTLVVEFARPLLRGGPDPDVLGEAARHGYAGLSRSSHTMRGGFSLW